MEIVEQIEESREIMQTRNPTATDIESDGKRFSSGQKWINVVTGEVWILFSQIKKAKLLQHWLRIKKPTHGEQ